MNLWVITFCIIAGLIYCQQQEPSVKFINIGSESTVVKVILDTELTYDNVMVQIENYSHLFGNQYELEVSIRQIQNLHIWDRLLIHDAITGLLEIQVNETSGKNTICVQI
jgi:hypothetical protein